MNPLYVVGDIHLGSNDDISFDDDDHLLPAHKGN